MKAEINKEKTYHIDSVHMFRMVDPNDPLQKAHNEFMMQHYRNLNMAAEYESSFRGSPLFPAFMGLLAFCVSLPLIRLILYLIFGV